ncbi:MAG: SRPBCC family protein, partial [Terricaulis sp.]
MTKRSSTHATFVIEREYPHPPAKVFAAFADPKKKARWFGGPDDWEKSNHKLDFRIGGKESISGGPPGGVVHAYNAEIWDIVENERIVLAYDMHLDATRISVSLATTEIKASATGTRLIYTEQGVYLD